MYGANEAADLDELGLPRYIRITDVNSDGSLRDDTYRSLPEEVARPYLLQDGDILLARSGATVGKSFQYSDSWGRAAFAGYLLRLRPDLDVVCPDFLRYFFQTHYYWSCIRCVLIQATIENVSAEKFKELVMPVPSMTEQRQIAGILDWKTGQIERLLAKNQALIERLNEERTALVVSAVTEGLNPSAPKRQANASWLHTLPAHWQVQRVKFIARIGNGSTPSRDDSSYWTDGIYPWLNSAVVNQEVVTEADQFVTPLALAECHLPIIDPPAVLVGITGQGRTRGMATTLAFQATINQHIAFVKPDKTQMDARYLRRVFDAAYDYLRSQSDGGGSTKGAITCEQIAEMAVPVPPLHEQMAIALHIEQALSRIDAMRAKTQAAIDRLSEYRTALITAAVTGQIDVREVAVPVPA